MEEDGNDDKLQSELHFEQRMCKVIMSMPEAVRDRFKLLKLLSDKRTKTTEASRQIDLKYEHMKAPLYDEREAVINGHGFKTEYIAKFDQKFEHLKKQLGKTTVDSDDCAAVDVKTDHLHESSGIPGFWLKVLKSHNILKDYIKKHDEPILKHLKNIKGQHFADKHGYELTFIFDHNEFMDNTEIVKTYHLADENVLEKAESSPIAWKDEKNPTKKKVTKTQKNKKTGATRIVTKIVDQESFFTFFQTLALPNSDQMNNMTKDEEDELAGRLDEDYDIGNDILNDIIPEAFEIYLGVVDNDYSSLDSGSDEDDAEGEDDDEDNADPKHPDSPDDKKDSKNDDVQCKQQ